MEPGPKKISNQHTPWSHGFFKSRQEERAMKRSAKGLVVLIVVCASAGLLWMQKDALRRVVPVRAQETEQKPGETKGGPAAYEDVRSKDLSSLDLRTSGDLLSTLAYNQATKWPAAEMLPKDVTPARILEEGKTPGLGVPALHARGITGKGVSVAIIDQPIKRDHPEYTEALARYENLCDPRPETETSMHGPAVASLLVGRSCGTAPGARLYHVAIPMWERDAKHYADALRLVMQWNGELAAGEKIRVVSISAAPIQSSEKLANEEEWNKALGEAQAAGLLVLDCTERDGFIAPCYQSFADRESPAACTPGFPSDRWFGDGDGLLLAPVSRRTTAEARRDEPDGYIYWGRGGLSWGIPYVAGVAALGWQVNPNLTAEEVKGLLLTSAHKNKDGLRIIDPVAFVAAAEKLGKE
jgi:hypothetical protein